MNCERFQTVLSDLVGETTQGLRRGEPYGLDANERSLALEHAVECEVCGLNWEEQRSLTAGLRSFAGGMKSLGAPPQLEGKLLAAFRERATIKQALRAEVRHFPAPRQVARYWIAAIAALLLIVFGIVAVRSRVRLRPPPDQANQTHRDVPAKGDSAKELAGVASPPQPEQEITQPPAPSPRRNASYLTVSRRSGGVRGRYPKVTATVTSLDTESNNEITTAFFPIVYGIRPDLQEGGRLLRVELPRTAVARFGLPVNVDGTSERVKADVLVGADGLAQAIRFVR